MDRTIVGYHQDDLDEWVADLSCGHSQHIRHNPPFLEHPWVLEESGRDSRLGQLITCPLCDRYEIPEGYRLAHTSTEWDEDSMPAALRSSHRLASGVWEQIVISEGRMRFVSETDPVCDVVITPDAPQAIPPEVSHRVEPLGPVRFALQFYQP
jgi:tellurite methyltransferase